MRHIFAYTRFVVGMLLIAGIVLSSQIISTTGVLAQDGNQCQQIVEQALSEAGVFCSDLSAGEACYGHAKVTTTMGQGEVSSPFTSGGDRVALASFESLTSSPLDTESGEWGIAVINLLPNAQPEEQSVTAVLYGDVTFARPTVPSSEPDRSILQVYNRGGAEINLRNGAGITYDVIAQLGPGAEAVADGRNEQGDWVRIQTDSGLAWVFTPLIGWEGDQSAINALAVLLPNDMTSPSQSGEPFQSFSLITGETVCDSAPSGMLLQASGNQPATLQINLVSLEFTDAIFLLTAHPNDALDIKVLQGTATVTARGISVAVETGDQTSVALGGTDGLTPTAAPTARRSYPFPDVAFAPLDLLPVSAPCMIGLPAINANVSLRVGPGTQRGELSTMRSDVTYTAIGWANDPDGLPWWELDTGTQSSWASKNAVRAIGACGSVAQVEPPPVVLAPPPVTAGGETASDASDLAPTTNSVWQMHPGTDNMIGQCSGAPAINFCDHLAAITPAAGGISWKGMEANPYYLARVQPNVYSYSGPNVLGTGNISMTLTFTNETSINMTMSLVLGSEPDCQHVYFYTGTRNW